MNKNRFKIGDRVKIKSWDEMVKEFGLTNLEDINCPGPFVKAMKKYCGEVGTITALNTRFGIDGKWIVVTIKFENNIDLKSYLISSEMIKHYKPTSRKVTDDEFTILSYLDKQYKYIARDYNGRLNIYRIKPEKSSLIWVGDTYEMPFTLYDHIFKNIKWTDKAPFNFRRVMKNGKKN